PGRGRPSRARARARGRDGPPVRANRQTAAAAPGGARPVAARVLRSWPEGFPVLAQLLDAGREQARAAADALTRLPHRHGADEQEQAGEHGQGQQAVLLPQRDRDQHGQETQPERQAHQRDGAVDQHAGDAQHLLLRLDTEQLQANLCHLDQRGGQTAHRGREALAGGLHRPQRRPISRPTTSPRPAAAPMACQGCSCTYSSVTRAASLVRAATLCSMSPSLWRAAIRFSRMRSRISTTLPSVWLAVACSNSSASVITRCRSRTSFCLLAAVSVAASFMKGSFAGCEGQSLMAIQGATLSAYAGSRQKGRTQAPPFADAAQGSGLLWR